MTMKNCPQYFLDQELRVFNTKVLWLFQQDLIQALVQTNQLENQRILSHICQLNQQSSEDTYVYINQFTSVHDLIEDLQQEELTNPYQIDEELAQAA